MVLFKESPPNIMVTRNPNWSTYILWFETSYVKRKILSPFKRFSRGRLHCWFCLKLLNVYSFLLWWFSYNIHDSGASEYSTTDTFNSDVGKYYVVIKQNKFKSIFLFMTLVSMNKKNLILCIHIFFIFM
jgi:hypothetical protein